STVIKEKRGMTLRQYVIAYRLRLAKSLLRYTTKTVAEIAEEAGFTDASYFTKTFRATFGETPKEWRAKFKEDYI
ncbi:MAG: helix-turn-helix transcriptional regulator, partial [Clostridia bacterium]|nr:helix-turn-helix transcriptional regulator [Clostridia bacterium]